MRLNLKEQHEMTDEFLDGGFNETQSGTLTSVLGKLLERQEAFFNKFRADLRADIEKMRQQDRKERDQLREQDKKERIQLREEDKQDRVRMREEDRGQLERMEASFARMRSEDKENRKRDRDELIRILDQNRRAYREDCKRIEDAHMRFETQMQRWIFNTLTALVVAGTVAAFGALLSLLT